MTGDLGKNNIAPRTAIGTTADPIQAVVGGQANGFGLKLTEAGSSGVEAEVGEVVGLNEWGLADFSPDFSAHNAAGIYSTPSHKVLSSGRTLGLWRK